jgi:hypothetical protein
MVDVLWYQGICAGSSLYCIVSHLAVIWLHVFCPSRVQFRSDLSACLLYFIWSRSIQCIYILHHVKKGWCSLRFWCCWSRATEVWTFHWKAIRETMFMVIAQWLFGGGCSSVACHEQIQHTVMWYYLFDTWLAFVKSPIDCPLLFCFLHLLVLFCYLHSLFSKGLWQHFSCRMVLIICTEFTSQRLIWREILMSDEF